MGRSSQRNSSEAADEPLLGAEPFSNEGDAALPGELIRVQLGSERIQAVQYNSFEVGPYAYETRVREGESGMQAHARAMKFLRQMRDRDISRLSDEHLDHIELAGDRARRAVGSKR